MKVISVLTSLLSVALLLTSSTGASFATTSVMKNTLRPSISNRALRTSLTIRGGSEEPHSEPAPPVDEAVPPPPPDVQVGLFGPKAAPPGFFRRTFPSLPWHRLPDYLTYMRCIAIPVLMVLFQQPNRHVETGTLFAFASFTDWLDGYLARRWDITSAFGAFLDPVADKLMVSTSLILLSGRYGSPIAIPTALILAREIAVSALREWMAQRGLRDAVKVGFQGKVKTALTMVALTVLLLVPVSKEATGFLSQLYQPGLIMLYLCTLVTITSGSVYFRAAAPVLLEKE